MRRRSNGAVRLEVIGEAPDTEARQLLQSAAAAGDVTWWGFVPSEEALARVGGSLAGLCLLKDLPNLPGQPAGKGIVEYSALKVPVIATPPLAVELVGRKTSVWRCPGTIPTRWSRRS